MAKVPKVDEKRRRVELLKQAKVAELFASKLRCQKCNMPVDAEMEECWNCGSDKAVDITKAAVA